MSPSIAWHMVRHMSLLQAILIVCMLLWTLVCWKALSIKKFIRFFSHKAIQQYYFSGLNYLIEQQPDQAIHALTQMLKQDAKNIEIQMALANLFRQRGEHERAIHIHQQLCLVDGVSADTRALALLELGRDYLASGVLDRAEATLLKAQRHGHDKECLLSLEEIYQRAKKWQQAIAVGLKLQRYEDSSVQRLAHYECELAEIALSRAGYIQAEQHLTQALCYDENCVRVYLLRSQIALVDLAYEKSMHSLQQVLQINHDYLSEVITSLFYCYQQLSDNKGFLRQMQAWLQQLPITAQDSFCIILDFLSHEPDLARLGYDMVAKYIPAESFGFIALLQQLQRLESSKGLGSKAQQQLALLKLQLQQCMKRARKYACQSCGFEVQRHYWLCPSCHQWARLRLRYDLPL